MDEPRDNPEIDPAIVQFAGFKSRQLAGKYGFARHDAEDLSQDLLLDYVERSKSYDSGRCSRRGFGRLLINNRVATLIGTQKAACRDHRIDLVSLNQSRGNSIPLGETLCDRRYVVSQLNLQLDVERILHELPAALMAVCRLLMVCDSAMEAAARAGLSRATLYRRLQEIRRAFVEAGLADEEAQPPA